MGWMLLRAGIAALTIVAVTEIAQRYSRLGALLLTLPTISIIAFVMVWIKYHDLPKVSGLAKETLILVPLGLPFFVPLAFADRFGIGFWTAILTGITMASITIASWFWLGPKPI
jgi:hypothetical protein